MIPYWTSAADERRPLVEHVVRRLAAREVGRVRERGENADEERPGDEPPGLARGACASAAIRSRPISAHRQATQYHSAHLTTYTQSHAARIAAVHERRPTAPHDVASAMNAGKTTTANRCIDQSGTLSDDERQRDRDAREGVEPVRRADAPPGDDPERDQRDGDAEIEQLALADRRDDARRAGRAGESARSQTTFCASRNASGWPIQTASTSG